MNLLNKLEEVLQHTNSVIGTLHLQEDEQKCSGTFINKKSRLISKFYFDKDGEIFTTLTNKVVTAVPEELLVQLRKYAKESDFSIIRLDLNNPQKIGSGIAELANGTPSSLSYCVQENRWY